ncbi:MAG: hypothetical protein LUD29_02285 [Clostridia bacterium]|nr:hypothetical protein [Clostridia bacterium]
MSDNKPKRKRKYVLFVCTGNTCRSPMAEAILNSLIKKNKITWWKAKSRGVQAEVGGTISKNSFDALKEIGVDPGKFKPKQLTEKDLDSSFLVVFMTARQQAMFPGRTNTCAMSDISGCDVPDPYGLGLDAYRKTRDAIYDACEKLVDIIKKHDEENLDP